MKKILVYIVSLSMLLSNNTMIMAAQTAENKNVQEKTTTVSFDSSSLTTKIGSFKSYDFQGIQSDQIENVFFEYIDEGSNWTEDDEEYLEDSSILEIEKKKEYKDDEEEDEIKETKYVPVAKKEGSVKIRATIRLKNSDETIKTPWTKFTVKKADSGVVPLKSYVVYSRLKDKDENLVDKNKDGQIDSQEIKEVNYLYAYDHNLTDEDMQGVNQAVNCESIDLEDNAEITKLDFAKNMSHLESLKLDGTGVPLKDRLDILRLDPEKVKKGIACRVVLKPKNMIKIGNTEFDINVYSEDENKLQVNKVNEDLILKATENSNLIFISDEDEEEEAVKKIALKLEPAPDDAVVISDLYLYNELLRQGDKNKDGYLTKDEAKDIKEVEVEDCDKVDLSGINQIKNLENLKIDSDDGVQNIDALKDLKKLKFLNLKGVDQKDVSTIGQLKELIYLELTGDFDNINSFKNLKNLEFLTLSSNNLEDISPISKLKNLEDLEIGECPKVADISTLDRNIISNLVVSKNVSAKQLLDYQKFTDLALQEKENLDDSIGYVSVIGLDDDDDDDNGIYTYKANDSAIINKYGECIKRGETDVTITAKAKDGKATKTIHVKVQNGKDLEPAGTERKTDELPKLTQNGYPDSRVNVVQGNGVVYDLNLKEKLAVNAKSYVANYVYCDDDYFVLKTKISKENELYTAIGNTQLKKQDLDIEKTENNCFLTKEGILYRINQQNKPEKIQDNVKDLKIFDEYGRSDDYVILYKDGTVKRIKEQNPVLSDVETMLSSDYYVLKNGTTIKYDWKTRKSVKIFDGKLKMVRDGNNNPYFMDGNTLYTYYRYSDEGYTFVKIADNVKQLTPYDSSIYQDMNGDWYYFDEDWTEKDDKLYYTKKKISYTNSHFTGISDDGTAYIYGNLILTDVVDMKKISSSDTLLIRKDGTIWKYRAPYVAEKMLDYDETKPDSKEDPIPEPEPTPEQKPAPEQNSAQTTTPQTQQIKVSQIKLSALSTKIAAGKKIKLTADITKNASNKTLKWTTSNSKVATVDKNGVVTIKKKAGSKTVKITAEATDGSGKKATFTIKVMKGVVKKVKISGKKTVKAGKTLKLKAKVTASKGANKKLKWTSSNPKYAIVSASGKVKASKAGKKKSVKITAMATDGSGKKATVKIKIK